ncbi:MAG: group III truncated hemoglobin [Balneolaceae bacterium]|nr:group III truncated hemoglobin [Balneolaceae bacterium]
MSMKDIRNDQDIKLLVHTFYGKVEDDERLGYIFNDVAEVDWDEHLPKMVDFWSNLLFQTRRYKGKPFRQHLPLPIEKQDFSRWFGLFESTVDELFEGERANHAKEMAARIASSFSLRMEMDGKFD